MDMNHKVVKTDTDDKDLNGVDSVALDEESDGDDESQSLLHPKKDDLSKKSEKPRRKVQWLDKNGSQLAEILEFQPDASDSDDDESDPCLCKIM